MVSWGPCYFPLFILRGNWTAKVCSLVLVFSAKAWNVVFLFVLQNKASLQMAHTRFSPSPCLNHKCLTPDNFSTVNLIFLQWLLTLSCLAVQLWQHLMGSKEGRQTPGTEYLHGVALQVIRMAIPINREADAGPSPPFSMKYIPH